MPSLKSNFIRTDITSQCFRYQFQLSSNIPVDSKYYHEIQGYFLSINQHMVFNYPYVYSVDQMKELKSFNFMLSNGQKVQIIILLNNTITLNSKQVSAQIHKQLMKGTNFLYSQSLQICLNPFQERKINYSTSIMPGFSLLTQINVNSIGFYLIPLEAKISQFHSLSSLHEHSIILDYNTGIFYKKAAIVRYDKANQIIYFRTGQKLDKKSLKSLQILPLSGYQLALKLNNYYKRLRESQKLLKFIQKWELKFDSRFIQIPYNFFPVSHILSRNNDEKSLGEAIGSISSYNFQFPFRKIFSNLVFEDSIRANIYFLVPSKKIDPSTSMQEKQNQIDIQSQSQQFYTQLVNQQEQFMLQLVSDFENTKIRMNLDQCKIQVFTYNVYNGWAHGMKKTLKQIDQFIAKQKQKDATIDKIFVLSNMEEILREQKQIEQGSKFIAFQQQFTEPIYSNIIKNLISLGSYYHLVDVKQNQFKNAFDIVGMKTFATIYSKLRLNPWKIKDIPFGTKPLIVFSLNVKLQTNGTILITLIGTLNAFLSKYTALISKCTQEDYQQKLLSMVQDSIQKFKSIHRIFPVRAMIYRTGNFNNEKCALEELQKLQAVLIPSYACKPTIIALNSDSPLRVYNQIDVNYISKDTVKPTQLLCQLRYNNQRYIQLQMWHPLYKIKIYGADPQDLSFEQKIIELTTKLCFTYQIMTELRFAKGLGFIGYGEKLADWVKKNEGNIEPMVQPLKEGVMVFL